LRAIDLYSGVGGWGLGLTLAGIEIVESYERWEPAIITHSVNLGSAPRAVDIRTLKLTELPKDIDCVVGSPPCTQFSYANRGGNGDIDDGLKDIAKFLEVVEFLKPKFWAMENVPRVAGILSDQIFERKGKLKKFAHLFSDCSAEIRMFDMSHYGIPQRRNRCIVGNLPFHLLEAYANACPPLTVNDVLTDLHSLNPTDRLYGLTISPNELFDNEFEAPLNDEEIRMNRDAKQFHPIYNLMSFPDKLDQPSRTIAATCTRVSRESIVIDDRQYSRSIRRLTIRERALLQGFPINFQFLGRSNSEKAKLVGNAVPPPFAYLVGSAMQGIPADQLPSLKLKSTTLLSTSACPIPTETDRPGGSYIETRRFRATIPNLRFKSGVRFELANAPCAANNTSWSVKFYYGTSKDIRTFDMNRDFQIRLEKFKFCRGIAKDTDSEWEVFSSRHLDISSSHLQKVWSRRSNGTGPYEIVDDLGKIAANLFENIKSTDRDAAYSIIERLVQRELDDVESPNSEPIGMMKLQTYATEIIVGLLIGCRFNSMMTNEEWTPQLSDTA
tara:strand:+ start:3107 stop:4771 length:1665 start_codon:yes stop_codon:yes gene_type:complete